MTLPIKLILLLCLTGCFPPCQVAMNTVGSSELYATYVSYGNAIPVVIFQNGELAIRYSDSSLYEESNGIDWGLDIGHIENEVMPVPWVRQLVKSTFYQYTLPPNIQRTLVPCAEFDGFYHLHASDDRTDDEWRIITNNPSSDFMADVQHSSYTIDEQDQVPTVYREYIRQKAYTDGLVNVPIVVEEVWEFDFDNDGKKEAFIVANNYLPLSEENNVYRETRHYKAADPRQLPEEGVGCYAYNLFYSETYLPIEFDSSETALIHDCFYPTPEEDYPISQPIYAYDRTGQLGLYELWGSEAMYGDRLSPPYSFEPIICDLNGDGLYDFLIVERPHFTTVKVYLQNAHGEFNYIGGIVFA